MQRFIWMEHFRYVCSPLRNCLVHVRMQHVFLAHSWSFLTSWCTAKFGNVSLDHLGTILAKLWNWHHDALQTDHSFVGWISRNGSAKDMCYSDKTIAIRWVIWVGVAVMCSLHTGTWSGLPVRDEKATRKRREALEKALIAEVTALGKDERPKSGETLTKWRTSESKETRDPVLPPPWTKRKADWDEGLNLVIKSGKDPDLIRGNPKMWDAEMIEMCGTTGKAELRGRACDLVEPVKQTTRDQMDVYHHQLPSPCNDRGSGFTKAEGQSTVRYNLQLDGRRPFLAGASGKFFNPRLGFLPQQDLALWDQERIMAPARAYRSGERGASMFHDEQRQGPAWKPAGSKARSGLSKVGARLMKAWWLDLEGAADCNDASKSFVSNLNRWPSVDMFSQHRSIAKC